VFPPAPGQGALAVQVRADDRDLLEMLNAFGDQDADASSPPVSPVPQPGWRQRSSYGSCYPSRCAPSGQITRTGVPRSRA
jgi:hypothetical protein